MTENLSLNESPPIQLFLSTLFGQMYPSLTTTVFDLLLWADDLPTLTIVQDSSENLNAEW